MYATYSVRVCNMHALHAGYVCMCVQACLRVCEDAHVRICVHTRVCTQRGACAPAHLHPCSHSCSCSCTPAVEVHAIVGSLAADGLSPQHQPMSKHMQTCADDAHASSLHGSAPHEKDELPTCAPLALQAHALSAPHPSVGQVALVPRRGHTAVHPSAVPHPTSTILQPHPIQKSPPDLDIPTQPSTILQLCPTQSRPQHQPGCSGACPCAHAPLALMQRLGRRDTRPTH